MINLFLGMVRVKNVDPHKPIQFTDSAETVNTPFPPFMDFFPLLGQNRNQDVFMGDGAIICCQKAASLPKRAIYSEKLAGLRI